MTIDGYPIFDLNIETLAAIERFVCHGEVSDSVDLDELLDHLDYLICVDFTIVSYSHLPEDYRRIKLSEDWHKYHDVSLLVRVGDGTPLHRMPNNFFIAGSAALNQYRAINPEPNDIDIYTTDGTIDDFATWHRPRFNSAHLFYTGTTIVYSERNRSTLDKQFILTNYRSIQECLLDFDLDCCKFAVTNDGLYATPAALWAVANRANHMPLDKLTDMNLSRVAKYKERGFEPLSAIPLDLLPPDMINTYSMNINVPDELKEIDNDIYFETEDGGFNVTVQPKSGVCRMRYLHNRDQYFSHVVTSIYAFSDRRGLVAEILIDPKYADSCMEMYRSIFEHGHRPTMAPRVASV